MEDKIVPAVVILTAVMVMSVFAGFNDELGKFLFAFLLIFFLVWLGSGGVQHFLGRQGSKGGIFPTPTGKKPTQIGTLA
jgi:hypothetical protein